MGHLDKAAEEAACRSERSRVASYPTQEKQGLLWVWGEAGPTAFIEAFATPAVANDLLETYPPGKQQEAALSPGQGGPGQVCHGYPGILHCLHLAIHFH